MELDEILMLDEKIVAISGKGQCGHHKEFKSFNELKHYLRTRETNFSLYLCAGLKPTQYTEIFETLHERDGYYKQRID